MIYMIIAGYFEDDSSDELTNDPVFKSVLNKGTLASQPTISRFHNRYESRMLHEVHLLWPFLCKRADILAFLPDDTSS